MTNNARIVRDYIVASCPNPERLLAALTALETELASAKTNEEETMIVLKRIVAIAEEHGWKNDGAVLLSSFLRDFIATAKADLERAQEEERERIIAVLQKEGGAFFRGRTGRWGEGYIEAAELRGLLTQSSIDNINVDKSVPRELFDAMERAGAEQARRADHLQAVLTQAREEDGQAIHDVLTERRRQIKAEGWTTNHDDEHTDGSLAFAAACYAAHSGVESAFHSGPEDDEHFDFLREVQDWVQGGWPWPRQWWKPSDCRRNLVKAGALILAEIERLDRAALAPE